VTHQALATALNQISFLCCSFTALNNFK